MTEQTAVKVIYVAGYGRSGSSLLDRLLSAATGATSCGELSLLFSWADHGRACACGAPMSACALWGDVLATVCRRSGRSLADLHAITQAAELHDRRVDEWASVWGLVFEALAEREISSVVDSSKTARGRRRPQLLRELNGVDVYGYVHLSRELPAVIHSRRRGNNVKLEDGKWSGSPTVNSLRAVTGWWRANKAARRMSRLAGAASYVTYEQLATNPAGAVSRILSDLHLAPEAGVTRASLTQGSWHTVGGNRFLRTAWDGDIRLDEKWRRELGQPWRALGRTVETLAVNRGILPPGV